MLVPFFVLLSVAISQIAAAPLEKRIEYDGSYKRLYYPYIQIVNKDGSKTILAEEDMLALNSKIESGSITPTTKFQLIGPGGFIEHLSDHHIRNIAQQKIAAIVKTSDLNQPGFGHLFITMDKNGIVQYFIYNLTLDEANKKVEKEGFPNSNSPDSYHKNPVNVA